MLGKPARKTLLALQSTQFQSHYVRQNEECWEERKELRENTTHAKKFIQLSFILCVQIHTLEKFSNHYTNQMGTKTLGYLCNPVL